MSAAGPVRRWGWGGHPTQHKHVKEFSLGILTSVVNPMAYEGENSFTCVPFEGIPADAGHVNKGHVKEFSAPLRVSAWAPDTCLDTPHLSRESGREGGQALAAGVAGPTPPSGPVSIAFSLSLSLSLYECGVYSCCVCICTRCACALRAKRPAKNGFKQWEPVARTTLAENLVGLEGHLCTSY